MKQLFHHIPLARKVSIHIVSIGGGFTILTGAVKGTSALQAKEKVYNVVGGHMIEFYFIGGGVYGFIVVKGDLQAYRDYKKKGGKW